MPLAAAAPLIGGQMHVESSGGVAVGRATTFNHFQASAPLTPVPLPHRIGRIPVQAPHFQPRDLADSLTAHAGRPLVLTGTAGTGKTQLAVEHAENAWRNGELRLLLWVADATRESVTAAYAQAAQDILGRYFFDPAEGAQAFLNWLLPAGGTEPRPWLVVLDGVAEPADLADGLWPPASPVGRVLVTSSRRDFDRAVDPVIVQVRPFRRQEATAYLERALARHPAGTRPPASLTALADRLGAVPASLALAVRHITAEGIDVPTYIQRLDDRGSGVSAAHAPLRLTVDAANGRHPAGVASPVLQLAAVFDESGVPRDVLTTGPALDLLTRLRGADRGADRVTAEDVTRAVRVLYDLSLVEIEELPAVSTVLVEAPVRAAVLAALAGDTLGDLVRAAAGALAAAWPQTEGSLHLARLLRSHAWYLLQEHGSTVLLRDGVPAVAFRAGRSAAEWGQAAEAADHFRLLARIAAAVLGPEHPDVLDARSQAAVSRGEGGDLRGAVQELAEVLDVQQRFGSNRLDTLSTRHHLATFRRAMTDGGAEAMAELAAVLADRTRVLGADHLGTLETRREIAWAHLLAFRAEFADEAHAVLAAVERVAGPDHRQTFRAREAVVLAHLRTGETDAADTAARQAAEAALRVFGPDHLATLEWRSWVAATATARGELATVEADLTALLGDEERLLGPEHPETLDTRGMLALRLREAGDAAGALRDYLALLADRRRILGDDHPRTMDTLWLAADCHGLCKQPVRAVVALAEVVAQRTRTLGPDHRDTLIARANLARWRGEAGDTVGAVIDLAAVAADQARVLGPDDHNTLIARHNLAWYQGEAGDPAGAVDGLTQVLADGERIWGADHRQTVTTREALAEWRRKAGFADGDS